MKKTKWWNKIIGMWCMAAFLALLSWNVQAEENKSQPVAEDAIESSEADSQVSGEGQADGKTEGAVVSGQEEKKEPAGEAAEKKQSESEGTDPSEAEKEKTYKGWIQKESGWYYYAVQGQRYAGWFLYKGEWYYLDGQDSEYPGRMAVSGEREIGGKYYRFDENGVMKKGWYLQGEDWLYYNTEGDRVNGWLLHKNKWYYLDGQDPLLPGRMLKDQEKQIGGATYRFLADGSMHTGWFLAPEGWYYYKTGGDKLLKGWGSIAGKCYYFMEGTEESPHKGLMLLKSEEKIDGQMYYFDASGAMRTGWLQKGNDWYYLRTDGSEAAGWAWERGKWYYLDPENGNKMEHGRWREIAGACYYFHGDGSMAEGWICPDGEWYYLAPGKGQMLTGWQRVGSAWYYFYQRGDQRGGPYGAMAKNRYIDSFWVDASGKWISSDVYSMQVRANGYSSPTPYLILVDCTANKVAIFHGSQGNWSNVQYWDCASGAPGTPTVKGVFHVGSKGHHFDSGGVRLYWYTQIYGDYLFHSLPYLKSNGQLWDGRLGIGTSHGCVRLPIECAKWIYDVVPYGTTIVTY